MPVPHAPPGREVRAQRAPQARQQVHPPARRAPPPGAFPRPRFNSAGSLLGGAPQGEKTVRENGGSMLQPFAQVAGQPLGTPWFAAFRLWVEEHKYYPTQAAQMGQQGSVTVRVVVGPDGRVRSVALMEGSGSPFLDLALQGMFRGAQLPALPLHVTGPVTVQVRMTYILR